MIALQMFPIAPVITWGHIIPCKQQHNLVLVYIYINMVYPVPSSVFELLDLIL